MNDDRLDRLYELLPTIYRSRDAEQGERLRALLRVIAGQMNIVEDDIAQLYDNWFIETCEDWVVPYLGDLLGYRPVHAAGEAGEVNTAQARARNRILIPRRDVANTIRNRRRKGTLALLEQLASDVADWPARVVEFATLLSRTQHLNHLRPALGRTVDLRNNKVLAEIDGPFDSLAHTVEVRRSNSAHTPGRYHPANIGLFVWRLKTYTVGRDYLHRAEQLEEPSLVKTPAYCCEEDGPQCYTLSVLGHDTSCFVKPQPETDPTHIAEELNLPVPIRRWAFDRHKEDFYGMEKSIEIWALDWAKHSSAKPLPPTAIIPADLSDWNYRPLPDQVAVDPVRGRLIFRPSQLPRKGVRVSYVYGFSADIGGGEYDRPLLQPAEFILVRVGSGEKVGFIADAWERIQEEWHQAPDKPCHGIIEIVDSGVYIERLIIELEENQSLQIRAANRVRPVLYLLDWKRDLPDALRVTLSHGSRITLDGLLISGRAVAIHANESNRAGELCPAEVNIRHCTLVPGWNLAYDCAPKRPAEPSLELNNVRARLRIEHSIIGSIQINEDQVHADPMPISITDSILDATSDQGEALGAPAWPMAHAVLTMQRCTVFGQVLVQAVALAENCIFTNCLCVARRQWGCLRFCYVPAGCRTPRRYHCQPDLAEQAVEAQLRATVAAVKAAGQTTPSAAQLEAEIAAARLREQDRVRPYFNSVRYGRPDYAQLADLCALEIKHGADDTSEMGVFHDLFNPQREANLRARLDEYTPAGMQTGIIFVN